MPPPPTRTQRGFSNLFHDEAPSVIAGSSYSHDKASNRDRIDRMPPKNDLDARDSMLGSDLSSYEIERQHSVESQVNKELGCKKTCSASEAENFPCSNNGGQKKECYRRKNRDPDLYDHPPIKTRFTDVIGHGSTKLRLDEILLPLALPSSLADSVLAGIRSAPASILLYGPPGCGKTQLARAVAGEAQAAFMCVGPSDVLSKFVGESEASVKAMFKEAHARALKMESRCTVLFFDEIDALGQLRGGTLDGDSSETSSRRILAELLIQLTKYANNETDDLSSNSESSDVESETEEKREPKKKNKTNFYHHAQHDTHHVLRSNNECDSKVGVAPQCQQYSPSNQPDPDPMNTLPSCESLQSLQDLQYDCTDNKFNSLPIAKPIGYMRHKRTRARRGTNARVIVIAATNRPEDCDPALLRRFSVRILIGLPSHRDRKKLTRRLLDRIDHSLTSAQLDSLAAATEDWTGSDLESLAREAVMTPVRECLRKAAVMKAKTKRKQQRGKTDSSQEKELEYAIDGEEAVRESLLSGFRSLRAVTLEDFKKGIAFWIGDNQSQHRVAGHFGMQPQQVHYDSTSSSDENDSIDD